MSGTIANASASLDESALKGLRAVLARYDPDTDGPSKSRKFKRDDWTRVESALTAQGGAASAATLTLRDLLMVYQPESTVRPKGRLLTNHDWRSITTILRSTGGSGALDSDNMQNVTTAQRQTAGRAQPVIPPSQITHCVRCHRGFCPTDRNARCNIPHVFEEFPSSTDYTRRGYSNIYRYDSVCCGDEVFYTEEGAGNGDYTVKGRARKPCVTLRHTTNPAAVTYNESNIVRCETGQNGSQCALDWLDMEEATKAPLSECNVYIVG